MWAVQNHVVVVHIKCSLPCCVIPYAIADDSEESRVVLRALSDWLWTH
jgi:hypothetical protein